MLTQAKTEQAKTEVLAHIWKQQYLCKMNINAKTKQTFSRIFTRDYFINQIIDNQVDVYMTMNPLKKVNGEIFRRKGYEASLKYLYLDLDVYNSEFARAFYGFTKKTDREWNSFKSTLTNKHFEELKQAVVFNIREDYVGVKFPEPTIVDSGRGLYLIWKIDEHIKAITKWTSIQRYLHQEMKFYGSDSQVVSDSVRVLRIVGSINSKTGTKVKYISKCDTVYTAYELMKEYMPEKTGIKKTVTTKMKRAVDFICAKDSNLIYPNFADYNETFRFIGEHYKKASKQELKQSKTIAYIDRTTAYLDKVVSDCGWLLLNTRDIPEGGKKELLFFQIAFCLMKQGVSYEETLDYLLEINSKMKYSKNRKYLESNIKSVTWASKEYQYNYSKSKLMELIEPTAEEQACLTYLKTKDSTERKQQLKENYVARRKAQGKALNEERRTERFKTILKLSDSGFKAVEIAEQLNVSLRTIRRDMAELKGMTAEEIGRLKGDIIDFTQPEEKPSERVRLRATGTENTAFFEGDKNSSLKLKERSSIVPNLHPYYQSDYDSGGTTG